MDEQRHSQNCTTMPSEKRRADGGGQERALWQQEGKHCPWSCPGRGWAEHLCFSILEPRRGVSFRAWCAGLGSDLCSAIRKHNTVDMPRLVLHLLPDIGTWHNTDASRVIRPDQCDQVCLAVCWVQQGCSASGKGGPAAVTEQLTAAPTPVCDASTWPGRSLKLPVHVFNLSFLPSPLIL